MELKSFDIKEVVLAKNMECAYVWLAKEEDTETFCCYSFDAEIYERNALTKHLAASRSEAGIIKVNKAECAKSVQQKVKGQTPTTMADKLLQEVKQLLLKRDFPNSTFLAVCTLKADGF